MRWPLGVFALVLLFAGRAAAEEGPMVLVLEPAEPVEDLPADDVADALDLSLGDLGIHVRAGGRARPGPPETQLAAATVAGRQARALAVVWYARAEDGRGLLVHVLDLRAGRATFEVLRVEATGDEAAARELALKVRHLLRVALVERAGESHEIRDLVAPILPEPDRRPVLLRSSLDYSFVAGPSGLRQGPGGGVWVAVRPRLEVGLLAGFLSAGERHVPTGRVRTDEVTATGAFQGAVLSGAIDLRAGPFWCMHFLESTGVTNEGRHGTRRAYVPEIGLVFSSRAHLHDALALGAGVAVGWHLGKRSRFLLAGEEGFDLGKVGLEIRIGLLTPGG